MDLGYLLFVFNFNHSIQKKSRLVKLPTVIII